MTVDEELSLLEDSVRRLKVEYDIYFGGGSKKVPTDTEWRVQSLVRKHSDGRNLNFQQRFRYNTITQKYALYNDLWRQKLRIKEEGYRRNQDALLGVQGVRLAEDRVVPLRRPVSAAGSFLVDDAKETSIRALFDAMYTAQRRAGQTPASWETFAHFVRSKTSQIRQKYACAAVEYTVDVQDGQVRLKARARQ